MPPASASPRPPPPNPPLAGAPAKAPKIDRDGDRVFDELEQRLATREGDDRVDVIVTLEDAASASRVRRLERRVGELSVGPRFKVVNGFAARVSKRQVARLAKRPDVAAVQSDGRVRALNAAGSSAFGVTKARIDVPSLDGDRAGGPSRYLPGDMVAAVLDTGVDARHRDLDGGKILGFANCVTGRCTARTPFDDDGHGTHVAGTLAGDGDASSGKEKGVAPRAGLVGVKVLDAEGSGAESAVIAGVDWAIANKTRYGIEAVNMSLGGSGCSAGTDAMSQAANRASAQGLLVVAAAGNEGPKRCSVSAPAAASSAVAVGSMADTGHGGFFASWTSGRGQLGRATVKPDVMAPGIGIISARAGTLTGYDTQSGTSSAAPFVTGVALLMGDAAAGFNYQDIRSKIKSTAVDWGEPGQDIDFGRGGSTPTPPCARCVPPT